MYISAFYNVLNQKIVQILLRFLFMEKFKTSWSVFHRKLNGIWSVSCGKYVFFHFDSKKEGI